MYAKYEEHLLCDRRGVGRCIDMDISDLDILIWA